MSVTNVPVDRRSAPPSDEVVAADLRVAGALASETRLRALRLVSAADDEVCVCEVEAALDVDQSTVSRALSRLHEAGLLERRKAGRWRYYRATAAATAVLAGLDAARGIDGD